MNRIHRSAHPFAHSPVHGSHRDRTCNDEYDNRDGTGEEDDEEERGDASGARQRRRSRSSQLRGRPRRSEPPSHASAGTSRPRRGAASQLRWPLRGSRQLGVAPSVRGVTSAVPLVSVHVTAAPFPRRSPHPPQTDAPVSGVVASTLTDTFARLRVWGGTRGSAMTPRNARVLRTLMETSCSGCGSKCQNVRGTLFHGAVRAEAEIDQPNEGTSLLWNQGSTVVKYETPINARVALDKVCRVCRDVHAG